MRTADRVLIVAMVLILIYWISLILIPDLTSPLTLLFDWMTQASILLGYPGAFLACFLGSASVVIEVPFAGVPFVMGGLTVSPGQFAFDPWLLGILSGIGATIGDMTSYALGYAGRKFVDETSTSGFSEFIENHPRATPLAVFILASTPLPVDPALVSLGVARYSVWKLFLPCLLGEVIFLSGVTWAGRLSLGWFMEILGIGGPTTPASITFEVLSIIVLIITVYAVIRVDWRKMTHSLSRNVSVKEQVEN
ncbi:MAG: VTT domain-containing protein [Candidatus Thorarchaeota archaeon]